MAYTTINKSTAHFNTKLHSGTGSTTTITGVGFQPDWTWFKSRSNANNHALYDAVRGASKLIRSNSGTAEQTNTALSAFTSDGVTLTGGDSFTNASGYTYASWNWKAGGAGSANTDGNINTTVSVNTTAGFSIVKYTGNGSATATLGHGLNAVPKMILLKKLNATSDWVVYHEAITYANRLKLDSTAAQESSANWRATPTSSVFNSNSSNIINNSGDDYIAYCFADVQGYSKFGSYTGNGNSDGPFIYTGFKPAFVMCKKTSGTGAWSMVDNKRPGYNLTNNYLQANDAAQEYVDSSFDTDLLSNGWKAQHNNGDFNSSGQTYIYMAFAEAPLVGSNGVTAKAR